MRTEEELVELAHLLMGTLKKELGAEETELDDETESYLAERIFQVLKEKL